MFGKERVRFLTRKGMQRCSLLCQWALTQTRTLWGGGLLQGGDLRLLEHGSERGGALGSDVVAPNTASEGQDGNDERVGVSMGVDTKANTTGWQRT